MQNEAGFGRQRICTESEAHADEMQSHEKVYTMSEELKKIDAECAVKIMNWPQLEIGQLEPSLGWWDRHDHIEVRQEVRPNDWRGADWRPTRDIAHAFQVMEKMKEKGFQLCLQSWGASWECTIWPPLDVDVPHCAQIMNESAMIAICTASVAVIKTQEKN